jgi:hypothetical protein
MLVLGSVLVAVEDLKKVGILPWFLIGLVSSLFPLVFDIRRVHIFHISSIHACIIFLLLPLVFKSQMNVI